MAIIGSLFQKKKNESQKPIRAEDSDSKSVPQQPADPNSKTDISIIINNIRLDSQVDLVIPDVVIENLGDSVLVPKSFEPRKKIRSAPAIPPFDDGNCPESYHEIIVDPTPEEPSIERPTPVDVTNLMVEKIPNPAPIPIKIELSLKSPNTSRHRSCKTVDSRDIDGILSSAYAASYRYGYLEPGIIKIAILLVLERLSNFESFSISDFNRKFNRYFPQLEHTEIFDLSRDLFFFVSHLSKIQTMIRDSGDSCTVIWDGPNDMRTTPMCRFLSTGELSGTFWDERTNNSKEYDYESLRPKLPQWREEGWTPSEMKTVIKCVHDVFYNRGICRDIMLNEWDVHRYCRHGLRYGRLRDPIPGVIPETTPFEPLPVDDPDDQKAFIAFNKALVWHKVDGEDLRPILEMAYDVSLDYDGYSSLEIKSVYDIILTLMANDINFGLEDLYNEIKEEFPTWDSDKISSVAKEEYQRILLKSRELKFNRVPGFAKAKFQWAGPIDESSHPVSRFLVMGHLKGTYVNPTTRYVSDYNYEEYRSELPEWSSSGWTLNDLKNVVRQTHDVFFKHGIIKNKMLSDWDIYKGCEHYFIYYVGSPKIKEPAAVFVVKEESHNIFEPYHHESLEVHKDPISLTPEFIREKCTDIINYESPITELCLFRTYCKLIGVKRITEKKREQIIPVMRELFNPDEKCGFITYWAENSDKSITGYRVVMGRSLCDVPLIEIHNAILSVAESVNPFMLEVFDSLIARCFGKHHLGP